MKMIENLELSVDVGSVILLQFEVEGDVAEVLVRRVAVSGYDWIEHHDQEVVCWIKNNSALHHSVET